MAPKKAVSAAVPKLSITTVPKVSITAEYDAKRYAQSVASATNFIAGVMAAPVPVVLHETIPFFWLPVLIFVGVSFGYFVGTFLGCAFKESTFEDCIAEATMAVLTFLYRGAGPLLAGIMEPTRALRIVTMIIFTGGFSGVGLAEMGKPRRKLKIPRLVLWFIIMASTVAIVGLAILTCKISAAYGW